jgi:hypothetical protein
MTHKLTNEQITDKLEDAHQEDADELGVEILNFGWGQSDYGICSKTTGGYLSTEIDPETLETESELEEYE